MGSAVTVSTCWRHRCRRWEPMPRDDINPRPVFETPHGAISKIPAIMSRRWSQNTHLVKGHTHLYFMTIKKYVWTSWMSLAYTWNSYTIIVTCYTIFVNIHGQFSTSNQKLFLSSLYNVSLSYVMKTIQTKSLAKMFGITDLTSLAFR